MRRRRSSSCAPRTPRHRSSCGTSAARPRPEPRTDIPGAWEVERVDEAALAEGRIWPQSRGSQLAGAPRRLTRGRARARPLRRSGRQDDDAGGRGRRGRGERGPRARARGERSPARRVRTSPSSAPTGGSCRRSSTGFDRALVDAPCSGLGVLASRPDLRWRAQPLPELQLELLLAAAERVKPGGTILYSVCTINADESEAVVDASGLAGRADRGLGAVPPRTAAGVPADAAAPPPDERVLHREAPGLGSPRWAGGTGCGRSRSSRRSTRRTSPASASRSSCSSTAAARVFHFDVGDGHFVPPVTIGPVVLRSIAPLIHDRGGRLDCHLMVDNPVHHFAEIAESGGDSVTFHVEAATDPAGVAAAARELGLGVGVAFNPGTAPEVAAEAAAKADADLCLCMSIVPGYSGQDFMDDAYGRIARARAISSTASSRSTAASRRATSPRCARPAPTCSSSAAASSRRRRPARPTAGSSSSSREPRARARAGRSGGRPRVPEADRRRCRRSSTARSWGRVRPRPRAATARSSRSSRQANGLAARRST